MVRQCPISFTNNTDRKIQRVEIEITYPDEFRNKYWQLENVTPGKTLSDTIDTLALEFCDKGKIGAKVLVAGRMAKTAWRAWG